jgi:hypothetical protein
VGEFFDIDAFGVTLYIDLYVWVYFEALLYSSEYLFDILGGELAGCSAAKVNGYYIVVFVALSFFGYLFLECFQVGRDFFVLVGKGYEVAVQADRFAEGDVYIE